MGKVFVATIGGHDLEPARRYGELTYLTTRGYNPHYVDRLMFELTEKLREFNPAEDYYLPVGQLFINMAALYILAQWHDKIPVLYWDAKNEKYVTVKFSPKMVETCVNNLKLREEIENDNQFGRIESAN